jgi:hypothetical protein
MLVSRGSVTSGIGSWPLNDSERASLDVQGFLSLHAVFTRDDIGIVRSLLNELFAARNREHGLLDTPLRLDRRLRETRVYQVCRAAARQLAGKLVTYSFDKAIYKPPHDPKGTLWHQDQAGPGRLFPMNTIHFWIPLQAVTEETGCMRYEMGSHQRGLLSHHRYDPADPYTLITNDVLSDRIMDCPLDVGDVLIHLPLTLHAAFPNSSPQVRRVWALLFRPLGRYGFLAPSRLTQQLKLIHQRWVRPTQSR